MKIVFVLMYCVERNVECVFVFRGRVGWIVLDFIFVILDVCICGGYLDVRFYVKCCFFCLIDVFGSDGLEKLMCAYFDLFAFEESGNVFVY